MALSFMCNVHLSYWQKLNKGLHLEFTAHQYNVKGEGRATSALCKRNQQHCETSHVAFPNFAASDGRNGQETKVILT